MTTLEVIKYVGLTGIGGLVVWLGKKYDWLRKRPIEIKKVEQEIQSGQIDDANSIVKTASEFTASVMAQLDRAEKKMENFEKVNQLQMGRIEEHRLESEEQSRVNFKQSVEIEALKATIIRGKEQIHNLLEDLAECLQIGDCKTSLKKIRERYGL